MSMSSGGDLTASCQRAATRAGWVSPDGGFGKRACRRAVTSANLCDVRRRHGATAMSPDGDVCNGSLGIGALEPATLFVFRPFSTGYSSSGGCAPCTSSDRGDARWTLGIAGAGGRRPTGAKSGMGLAVVRFLLDAGVKVMMTDRGPELLEAVGAQAQGRRHRDGACGRSTEAGSVDKLRDAVRSAFGPADILVHAARDHRPGRATSSACPTRIGRARSISTSWRRSASAAPSSRACGTRDGVASCCSPRKTASSPISRTCPIARARRRSSIWRRACRKPTASMA